MDKGPHPGRHVISLEDIPEEGLRVSYEDVPGLMTDPDDPDLEGPVGVDVYINRVDRSVYLQGSVKAVLHLVCDRCLGSYPFEIDVEFSYLLTPSSLKKDGVSALTENDIDVFSYDGKDIPLGELLREQILLQIPFRRLCSEGCKGLCHLCGADLNKEVCHCKKDIEQGPFAVLNRLKI